MSEPINPSIIVLYGDDGVPYRIYECGCILFYAEDEWIISELCPGHERLMQRIYAGMN